MEPVTTVRVPHAPASVAVVRHCLCDELASAGIAARYQDDAGLVASELVGNAYRHAAPLPDGDIRASWDVEEGRLVLAVTDGGAESDPAQGYPEQTAADGRGLAIVEALAQRWGVIGEGRTPTTVWAELPLAA